MKNSKSQPLASGRSLNDGGMRFQILGYSERSQDSEIGYRDPLFTTAFLRQLKGDPFNMATLRQTLAQEMPLAGIHRWSDEEVIAQVAWRVNSGHLKIAEEHHPRSVRRVALRKRLSTPPAECPTNDAKQPGPALNSLGLSVQENRLKELALDLAQIAFDIAGMVDPTPISDGTGLILSAVRGDWWGASLSGIGLIPYVGDLAKAGKLPKYIKTVENAVSEAKASSKAARILNPVMQRIQKALDLLPDVGGREVQYLRKLLNDYLKQARVAKLASTLPDISKQFKFDKYNSNGYIYQRASGRLGVPGKIKTHRSKSSQSNLSSGTGDDAGHLIGDRFGPPGDARNLGLQNWKSNRYGSFKQLEDLWADKLKNGIGVDVDVLDITKEGATRPFKRSVKWTETSLDGSVTHHEEIFGNFHTLKSREGQNISPTVLDPLPDNVIHFKSRGR